MYIEMKHRKKGKQNSNISITKYKTVDKYV